MRFRRLKISVGIALVLFIFIVANTIAFGLFPDNDDKPALKLLNQTTIDNKPVLTIEKNTTQTTTTTPAKKTSTVTNSPNNPAPAPTTTVTQTTRTRAS